MCVCVCVCVYLGDKGNRHMLDHSNASSHQALPIQIQRTSSAEILVLLTISVQVGRPPQTPVHLPNHQHLQFSQAGIMAHQQQTIQFQSAGGKHEFDAECVCARTPNACVRARAQSCGTGATHVCVRARAHACTHARLVSARTGIQRHKGKPQRRCDMRTRKQTGRELP